MKTVEDYLNIAIKEAQKCFKEDEVPVGCIIVKNNKIIARAHNQREKFHDVSGHAEILAIRKANKKLNDWQLVDCDIYVTLEPCLMCAGAILQSRIQNIYFGAYDFKGGAFGSSINVLESKNLNHIPKIKGGIKEEECSSLLKFYFKGKRK